MQISTEQADQNRNHDHRHEVLVDQKRFWRLAEGFRVFANCFKAGRGVAERFDTLHEQRVSQVINAFRQALLSDIVLLVFAGVEAGQQFVDRSEEHDHGQGNTGDARNRAHWVVENKQCA